MRVGIITDSTCDLSREYLDKHNINILPISIIFNEKTFLDDRNTEATHKFRKRMEKESLNCESSPFTKEQITNLFLEKLVIDYDYIICITVSGTRSLIYENARAASFDILNQYREIRKKAGIRGSFKVVVIDSQQLFTGQAAVVAEAAYRLSRGMSPLEVIEATSNASNFAKTYLVPASLERLRFQARKKGDRSVSFMSYLLGSALDIKPIIKSEKGETNPIGKVRGFEAGVEKVFEYACKHISKGLMCDNLCISYGGNISEITNFPGYKKLADVAKSKGVIILLSEMSATAIVNIGPNSLGVGFVSKHEIPF